jgi:hypothetical protein
MEPGYMLSIYTGSGERGRKIRDVIFAEAKKNQVTVSKFLLAIIEKNGDGVFSRTLKKLLRS